MNQADVLLSGIVGSTAYGLATPDSDIDRLGVFAAPTTAFHGLRRPRESIVSTSPDRTLHEAGKYASLCLAGNPTAMELLWLPDELYDVRTALGDDLVGIRTAFLSADRVRDAYLGYAGQQFRKLESRAGGTFCADTRGRTAKHARHLARLIAQGRELYATGTLRIRVEDPRWLHDFGDRVAAGGLDDARRLLATAEEDFAAIRSVLPRQPDEEAAEKWLRAVRVAHLAAEPYEIGADLDENRPRQVGTETETRAWTRAATGTEPEPQAETGLGERGVFMVDIDGTVALRDHDLPRTRTPYEWHRVGEDLPNRPVISVVRALAAAGHRIVYLSGRSEECRAATSFWLAEHVGVPGEALLMRPAGDNRRDDIVKKLLYRRLVRPRWEVIAVLDDRDQVVRMWRDLGLTVLQVAEGDF